MRRLITWFAANPVAANLLMWLLIIIGVVTLGGIKIPKVPAWAIRPVLRAGE